MWSKKPRVGASADAPAAALPGGDRRRVGADERQESADPPGRARPQARHRMAGSHEGMYVTEHHRGAKKG